MERWETEMRQTTQNIFYWNAIYSRVLRCNQTDIIFKREQWNALVARPFNNIFGKEVEAHRFNRLVEIEKVASSKHQALERKS